MVCTRKLLPLPSNCLKASKRTNCIKNCLRLQSFLSQILMDIWRFLAQMLIYTQWIIFGILHLWSRIWFSHPAWGQRSRGKSLFDSILWFSILLQCINCGRLIGWGRVSFNLLLACFAPDRYLPIIFAFEIFAYFAPDRYPECRFCWVDWKSDEEKSTLGFLRFCMHKGALLIFSLTK